MANFYEFKIRKMCEQYTKEQLAEMVLSYKESKALMEEDYENVLKENHYLMHLIAKYRIEKEQTNENNRSKSRH